MIALSLIGVVPFGHPPGIVDKTGNPGREAIRLCVPPCVYALGKGNLSGGEEEPVVRTLNRTC